MASTIEQVTAKLKRSHLDLVQLFLDIFMHANVPEDDQAALKAHKEKMAKLEGAWFNEATNFKKATSGAFEGRGAAFEALKCHDETWEGAESTATMCAREGEQHAAIEVLKKVQLGMDEADAKVRLARWIVEEKRLAPPWPATLIALDESSLARLITPELVARDRVAVGKRVMVLDTIWRPAIVTDVGDTIDVKVQGLFERKGLPRTEVLVDAFDGAGAVLHMAAGVGKGSLVHELLRQGVSPFVADGRANSPLHAAAAGGHASVCRALQAAGLDWKVKNVIQQNAEVVANLGKHFAVARLFNPTLSDEEFTERVCMATERRKAAAEGRLETLRKTRDTGEVTALMVVCRFKQADTVKVLIEAKEAKGWCCGAASPIQIINAQSAKGCTALYLAAEEGDVGIMQRLLEGGAKVGLTASDHSTPLMRACRFGYHLCVHALLEAGADVNATKENHWTALMFACQTNHLEVVRNLLMAKADPNKAANKGFTALTLASQNGNEQCVLDLIEAGAAVNARLHNGEAALNLACQNGHLECTKVLLSAGANVELAKDNGFTALMKASQNGHDHVLLAVLEAGAAVNATLPNGEGALNLACQNGQLQCTEVLLKAGADVELTDKTNGFTSLMKAAQNGHDRVARDLLKAGAAVDAVENKQWTALMFAAQGGHDHVLRELLVAGADVNHETPKQVTALNMACENEHEGCALLLLRAGADATVTDAWGDTPRLIAQKKGMEAVLALMQ